MGCSQASTPIPGNVMTIRLLYLVSHPIQYQAPLLRRIAGTDDIELTVSFATDGMTGSHYDPGFGAEIEWNVPLTDGYRWRVDPAGALGGLVSESDAVWLHGWQGARMWRALAAARRQGVPVLMRSENTLAAQPDGAGPHGIAKRAYLGWILARSAAFLCNGAANRDYYLAHGVDPDRLFSMPYAVDNDFFRSRAAAAAARREDFRAGLGLEAGRPVILFAGKLQQRKNPLTLLAAFAQLERVPLHRPYVVIVGDGELHREIERAADADSDIRFLGFRDQTELPALYDLADVFVLASYREPWGLAINEAMNASTAVIASDECGAAHDLIDENCGVVVAPGDAGALASALTLVLSDPDRCRAMGNAAAARVEDWGFDADIEGLRAALASRYVAPRTRL